MSEFLESNKHLDDVINGATNFESLREQMKSQLAKDGVIARDVESLGYAIRLLPGQQQASEVPLPASQYALEKEIRWAESTGKRPVVIRANSQADLDELERQVTR